MKKGKKITINTIICKTSKHNRVIVTALWMISIFIGIVPIIQLEALSELIDLSIQQVSGESSSRKIVALFLLILASYFLLWSASAVVIYLQKKLMANIRSKEKVDLLTRYKYLGLEDIEKGTFHDLNLRIINNFEPIYQMVFDDLWMMISMIIRVISIISIIAQFTWWCAITILVFIIPLIYYSFYAGQRNYQVSKLLARQERQLNYYSEIMTDRESVLERTLFGFTDHINAIFRSQYEKWYHEKQKVDLKNLIKKNMGMIISTFSGIVTFILLLSYVLNHVITIGLFISLVYAVFNLGGILSGKLTAIANEYAKIKEYIKDLNEYYKWSEHGMIEKMNNKKHSFQSLEFRNVSFKYQNSEKYILQNFSCIIEKNQHYALVGLNGAGKTTFVKLALGLYQQFEGNILLNNQDIRSYTRKELNSICAAIFQDFARYEMTMNENIFMNTNKQYSEWREVLDQIQISHLVKKMPNGLVTQLGKLTEDGIELSGGEWQKIALARLMVRDAALLFLMNQQLLWILLWKVRFITNSQI